MEVETADPDALLVLASGGKSLRQAAEEFQASFIPAMEVASVPGSSTALLRANEQIGSEPLQESSIVAMRLLAQVIDMTGCLLCENSSREPARGIP